MAARVMKGRTGRSHRVFISIALLLAVALCMSLLGGGTGYAKGTDAATPGTINIGMVNSISGDYSVPAFALQTGAQVEVNRLNSQGVLVNGRKYRVKLLVQDDQSTPSVAAAATSELVNQDKVPVLIGPIGTLALPTIPLANNAHAIQMTLSSSAAPSIGTPEYPLVFGGASFQARVYTALASINKWVPSAKKIALVGANDAGWTALAPALKKAAPSFHLQMQPFEYPAGTVDFSALLDQVEAYKPDVIFVETGVVADDTALLQQMTAAGISKQTWVFVYGVPISVATAADGRPVISATQTPTDITENNTPAVVKFRNQYLALCRCTTPPPNSSVAVEYAYFIGMAVEAMQKAKTTTDTTKIAQALVKIKYQGLGGPISFGSTTHLWNTGLDETKFVNGKTSTAHFG
jgi:branched-chain amino acid transport system substrate-binding protein